MTSSNIFMVDNLLNYLMFFANQSIYRKVNAKAFSTYDFYSSFITKIVTDLGNHVMYAIYLIALILSTQILRIADVSSLVSELTRFSDFPMHANVMG